MPSTGQPSSNRSLVGNTRYAGVGNPFVPGNRIPSPAMRNSLVDRQEAQSILKTTDQLGLGDGVMVSVDHLTNVATGALKNVVPDVLNQLRDLGASASKLLSGASSRMAGTSGSRSNSGSSSSTTPSGVFSARKVAISGNGGGVLASVADQARVATYTVTVSQTAAGQTTTSGRGCRHRHQHVPDHRVDEHDDHNRRHNDDDHPGLFGGHIQPGRASGDRDRGECCGHFGRCASRVDRRHLHAGAQPHFYRQLRHLYDWWEYLKRPGFHDNDRSARFFIHAEWIATDFDEQCRSTGLGKFVVDYWTSSAVFAGSNHIGSDDFRWSFTGRHCSGRCDP